MWTITNLKKKKKISCIKNPMSEFSECYVHLCLCHFLSSFFFVNNLKPQHSTTNFYPYTNKVSTKSSKQQLGSLSKPQASAVSLKYKDEMLVCKQESPRLWTGRPTAQGLCPCLTSSNSDQATASFCASIASHIVSSRKEELTSYSYSYLISPLIQGPACQHWQWDCVPRRTLLSTKTISYPRQPHERVLFSCAQSAKELQVIPQ